MADELDDLDALAADYVLGTLDHDQRREAEARLARDPRLADLVDEWTQRLAPIAEGIPPVDPPARVWQSIEDALGTAPGRGEVARLRRRVAFWRWCTAGAAAVAAALVLYLAVAPQAPLSVAEKRYFAVLNEGEASPAWLITLDIAEKRLTIRPLAEVGVEGKSLELWVISGTDVAPRSLGLLDPGREISIAISAEMKTSVLGAAALAVSLEPAGGSPTALPTGPVLYQGAVMLINE